MLNEKNKKAIISNQNKKERKTKAIESQYITRLRYQQFWFNHNVDINIDSTRSVSIFIQYIHLYWKDRVGGYECVNVNVFG